MARFFQLLRLAFFRKTGVFLAHGKELMMKPFEYTNFIGDFFDVLHKEDCQDEKGEISFLVGGTKRREAIISILSGNFDIAHVPALALSVNELVTSTVRLVVLDLSRVRVFCPNAVAVLVNLMDDVEGRGKRFILYRPSQIVRHAIETLGLSHLFDMLLTEEELLLALPD